MNSWPCADQDSLCETFLVISSTQVVRVLLCTCMLRRQKLPRPTKDRQLLPILSLRRHQARNPPRAQVTTALMRTKAHKIQKMTLHKLTNQTLLKNRRRRLGNRIQPQIQASLNRLHTVVVVLHMRTNPKMHRYPQQFTLQSLRKSRPISRQTFSRRRTSNQK